jgi:predicted ribosomally synthesized peptide with SipW-like signal peptide
VVNKKIIVSLLTLGMLAAVVSAGTWAYFSDARSVNNDTITAGTIILNGVNSTTTGITIPNAIPGDNNVLISNVTLSNAGSIPGDLYVNITAPTAGAENLLSHLHIYLNGQLATPNTPVDLGNLQPGNANSIPVAITYSYDNLIVPQNSEQGQTIRYNIEYSLIQSVNMPANVTINP